MALAALPGCKPNQKAIDRFTRACVEAEFTPKQCAFLYALQSDNQADADANFVVASSVMAMGILK